MKEKQKNNAEILEVCHRFVECLSHCIVVAMSRLFYSGSCALSAFVAACVSLIIIEVLTVL